MIDALASLVRSMFDASPAPWFIDLAAALAAGAAIWRYGGRAVARGAWGFLVAIHRAIDAAPEIARLLNEAVEILRGDVLERLKQGAEHFQRHDEYLEQHAARLENHEVRIARLESPPPAVAAEERRSA